MFAFIVVSLGAVDNQLDQDPSQLTGRCLTERKRILTGDIEYTVTADLGGGGPSLVFRTVFDYTDGKFWLRSESAQPDHVVKVKGSRVGIESEGGKHVERLVLKDGTYIAYSPDQFSDGSQVAVVTGDSPDAYQQQKSRIVDPLAIGLCATSFGHLGTTPVDYVFKIPMTDPTISKEVENGILVTKLSFRSQNEVRVSLWISADQGHSLIRAQIDRTDKNDGRVSNVLESHIQHFEAEDLWYPDSVSFQTRVNDEVVFHEKIKVVKAVLNRPVDPDEFSLSALGIRVGTPIHEPTNPAPNERVWDGDKPVELYQKRPELPKPDRSKLYFLAALNLAILAVISFAVYVRQRAK